MRSFVKTLLIIFLLTISGACISPQKVSDSKKWHISVQAGVNRGGIVENTDMEAVPNAIAPPEATVDAFSGATHLRYNGGIHISRQLKSNHLETGVDYVCNYQTFNYMDAGNSFIGVRRLNISQIMLPLTYNFVLFRSTVPKADIQLKAGLLGQFNSISSKDVGISLPTWSFNPWSAGITCGISAYPVQLSNGSKLGFYVDVYRGSQIYEDFYNQNASEMPGSSFLKGGIRFQFK